jgi:hypothetical protein
MAEDAVCKFNSLRAIGQILCSNQSWRQAYSSKPQDERIERSQLKLADLEKQERSKLEGQQHLVEGTAFFRDLAKEYLERLDGMPNLKPRTKEYYKERLAAMQKSWAELNDTDVRRLSEGVWTSA